jgi:hypothetical protein
METIIIQADAKKAKAIKDFLKAFDIAFKTSKKEESPYDPEFVKMVLERSKNAKEGSTTRLNPNDIWGSLGLK